MSQFPPYVAALQRQLSQASTTLHRVADQIVNECEAQPELLEQDSAVGDELRAALENARKWRARMEGAD